MAFPSNPLPTLANYEHLDPNTGRSWNLDDGVWIPKENAVLNDLTNVVGVTSETVGGSETIGSSLNVGTSLTDLGTGSLFARFEFNVGADFTLDSIRIGKFYRSAANTTAVATLEVFDGVADPAFTQNPLSFNQFSAVNNALGVPKYTTQVSLSTLTTSTSGADLTFSFASSDIEVLQKGRLTALLTITNSSGSLFYIGDFENNYTVTGKVASGLPIDGSLVTFKGTESVTEIFTGFNSTTTLGSWTVNGDATLDAINDHYVLTNPATNQAGWVTHDYSVPLSAWESDQSKGINAYFIINSSLGSGNPADGFSFNIYDFDSTTSTVGGGTGSTMASNGAAVSARFNIYQTDEFRIFKAGTQAVNTTTNSVGSSLSFYGRRAFRIHLYQISTSYYLDVYYGTNLDYSNQTLIRSTNLGNISSLFTGDQGLRFQFGAATGLEYSKFVVEDAQFNFFLVGEPGGKIWQPVSARSASDYNYIVRQASDPTPADLSTWREGTYWVNTSTNTLFIHNALPKSFGGGASWVEIPKFDGTITAPAVVTYLTTVTPVSPQTGAMWINTFTNQLSIWTGSTWQAI